MANGKAQLKLSFNTYFYTFLLIAIKLLWERGLCRDLALFLLMWDFRGLDYLTSIGVAN